VVERLMITILQI